MSKVLRVLFFFQDVVLLFLFVASPVTLMIAHYSSFLCWKLGVFLFMVYLPSPTLQFGLLVFCSRLLFLEIFDTRVFSYCTVAYLMSKRHFLNYSERFCFRGLVYFSMHILSYNIIESFSFRFLLLVI